MGRQTGLTDGEQTGKDDEDDSSKPAATTKEKAIAAQRKAADAQLAAAERQQQAAQAQQRAYEAQQIANKAEEEFLATGGGAAVTQRAEPVNPSRRTFLKVGAGFVAGAAVASAAQIPLYANVVDDRNTRIQSLTGELGQANNQVSQLKGQVGSLQSELSSAMSFLTLNLAEQTLVEAIVETIIPSDGSGPGAKEAGVINFIDKQLAGDYGRSGNMFMEGPFVSSGQSSSLMVEGKTYSSGSPKVRVGAGTRYQYALNLREFWRTGLTALQAYANSAYGGNFETLQAAQQMKVLQDLWTNVPKSFGGIVPQDFAYELTFIAWSGFLMDPVYGGNKNMVGWAYTGFNGVNLGNAYNEGMTQMELMVAKSPTRLQPASLAQFQGQTASGGAPAPTPTSTSQSSSSSSSRSQSTGASQNSTGAPPSSSSSSASSSRNNSTTA